MGYSNFLSGLPGVRRLTPLALRWLSTVSAETPTRSAVCAAESPEM